MAAGRYIGGNISENFCFSHNLLLILLGLFYLWGFIGLQGVETDRGFRARNRRLRNLGVASCVLRSVPELLYHWHWIKTHPVSLFCAHRPFVSRPRNGLSPRGHRLPRITRCVLTRPQARYVLFAIAYIVLISSTCIRLGNPLPVSAPTLLAAMVRS